MVMSFRVVVGDSSKGPPDDRAWFGADQRGRYTTLRGTTAEDGAGGPYWTYTPSESYSCDSGEPAVICSMSPSSSSI